MSKIRIVDRFDREISRLRISVISSCNLSCPYCHKEGYDNDPSLSKLSLEQIRKLTWVINKYDLYSVKLTGGEPLLHPQIIDIVRIISEETSVTDISMTTNGLLLNKYARKLKDAGLNRVNISCDSYHYNRLYKSLDNIKDEIKIAQEVELTPIKINMVLLKSVNEDEVEPMIQFAGENNLILQIIELINIDKEYFNEYHLGLEKLEEELEARAIEIRTRKLHLRRQYKLENGAVVELVKPEHNHNFCMNCRTLRVTNDFKFQPCLYRTDNLVPIGDDIQTSLKLAIERRRPFFA
ncbi:MAG: GTP 3',8-cyclase MoaA [Candidatus Heimdallarchaeaceae archaeon]